MHFSKFEKWTALECRCDSDIYTYCICMIREIAQASTLTLQVSLWFAKETLMVSVGVHVFCAAHMLEK